MNNVQIRGWSWDKEKLITTRKYTWTCPKNIHGTWTSNDGILTIVDDQWTVDMGYVFDNCSNVPSGGIDPDPNPPVKSLTSKPVYILWKSSIGHDLGYQNMDEPTFPFSRKEVDEFFRDSLRKQGYKYARIYYIGVRTFGGIFHWVGRIFKLF